MFSGSQEREVRELPCELASERNGDTTINPPLALYISEQLENNEYHWDLRVAKVHIPSAG